MYIKRNIAAYSVAIFDLVQEEHAIQAIQPEFEELLEVLKKHPELVDYLANDLIPEKERLETIKLVFQDFHWIIRNTIEIVFQRRMIQYLRKILIEYLKLANKELKIRFVRVVSAFPLSEDQLEAIKLKLQKESRRTIELKHDVDPTLISGIRIESRTEILEMNIKHDLDTIQKIILKDNKKKGN
ncbi:ATP synthase F1 subunit delta [Mycoplasmopsis gallopavonis]|uniref:ATP synthase subunit delta n=1 Tax=Mycoplasmopsis gallopavonis TaxID=76629 RepID=A0A449AZ75_9BACT|nr:ATP synthase F1 subunit delta [Mycoplasmopsis gallopavonis]RIV16652.1 ATP synthase F1 subunit delta [Mycoplasmopsis gallopavonis]VEU72849.1 ATP synthase subunit delta [Mycoplasmopsis gallopavonis]